MGDARFEVVKRGSKRISNTDIDKISNNVNNVYSNINTKGNSHQIVDYARHALDTALQIGTAPTPNQSSGGNGLLDSMKNNSNALAKSMSDLANVTHTGNIIAGQTVSAIENMGSNLTSTLSHIANVLNVGNRFKDIDNQLRNFHNNIQTQKNNMVMDKLDFEMHGYTGLVDSKGNPIKPREARAKKDAENAEHTKFLNVGDENLKDTNDERIIPNKAQALKDAEQGIEEKRMNSVDQSSILSGIAKVSDSMFDSGDNLIKQCLDFFVDVDSDKLDNLLKDDKEFANG